jgi:hypothetical protein
LLNKLNCRVTNYIAYGYNVNKGIADALTSRQKTKIMKKTILNLATFALLSIVLFSCRKNDTIENLNDLYDNFVRANIPADQLFTINATTGGIITGARGTKITFPPNAFANPDNSITTGSVTVFLKEALDKSQWLMSGLSTTTIDGILVSGGMIDLKAFRSLDGAELKPAPTMIVPTPSLVNVIKAEVPRLANRPDTLRLFLPIGGATGNNNTPPAAWANAQFPFVNSTSTYTFQIPQFRWANCDALYGQPGPKTTIKVTPDLTGVTGATEVKAMLVYKNLSTVITLPASFQSYTNSIPVGSTADVVCIGKDAAGKIIFAVKPATTFTALMDIPIKPVVTDAATVTAYLNTIN